MYAIVEIKGKQYKAEKGVLLSVDFYDDAETGKTVEFPVLFVSDDGKAKVGTPYVEGAKVSATFKDSFRDKKIEIFNYKRRKGFRKSRGHRQSYTTLLVNEIVG